MKKTLLFLLFSIITTAQSLDPTFDTDGLVNNPISTTPSIQNAYDGILQPDGKMIYVGRSYTGASGFIVRYNIDGTKDTTFGNGGFITLASNGFQSVTLQIDGKIIIAGTKYVYRLTANGLVDTTFNGVGYKTISLAGQNMNIKCVSVQSDNKIVVSGFISNGTNNDVAVARLNTDGTFDTTFDTDGIYTFISSSIDNGFTHKIQADGKIVIVGDTGATSAAKNFLIIRLNINGTLDTTFNLAGYAITDFASSTDYARDIQILSDNSILVLGTSAGNIALTKYTSAGLLDTTFNTTGKKTFAFTSFVSAGTSATGLHNFPKLKVLTFGEVLISSTSNVGYSLLKLNAVYNLDSTFGTNGVFALNSETDLSAVLQVKPNGNIITGGTSYTSGLNSDAKIKEVEITANGVLINLITKNLFLGVDKFVAMNKNANGDIFVLAKTPNPTLSKYNSFGQLDTSFDIDGVVNLSSITNNWLESRINFFSDKIFVSTDYGIYKLNSNGSLDLSFDGDGFIDLDLALKSIDSNWSIDYMNDFKIDSDGNLVVGLDFLLNYSYPASMGIIKFLNSGTIDTTFGNNGLFTTRFNSDINYVEYPCKILFQNDSKIKIVGTSMLYGDPFSDTTFCALRLNTNGSLDTSFGTSGKITHNLSGLINWTRNSYIFNDNSYLCYMLDQTQTGQMKSIKFLPDGTVDLSHGTNGISNDFVGSNNTSMVFQADGKYLKAGTRNNHFSISRYNADGSVDTTFGTSGELNPIVGYASSIADILLQDDGKIVVGGSSLTSDNQLAVLARFTNTVLGTLDFSESKNVLSIYPNPIETSATFQFTLNNSENITVELYDVQGKLVQTIAKNKSYAAGNHNLPIELQYNLNSGNYLLKLTTQTGSQSIQIIKK